MKSIPSRRPVASLFAAPVLLVGLFLLADVPRPSHAMPLYARYTIYCVNGRIEISYRTEEEMKSARGANVCAFDAFDRLVDAENAVKRFGGVGAPCQCRK